MVTVWTHQAIEELRKAYDYISRDSPQNARMVVDEITRVAEQLPAQPEMFPPDKFKKNNDGTWRAFEKYHYRISYLITSKEIRPAHRPEKAKGIFLSLGGRRFGYLPRGGGGLYPENG